MPDDEHRQTYLDSIRGIVNACVDRGIRVFICSAAVTAADPFESEGSFLQQMCDEGMSIAREHGGQAIDLQRTMREIQQRTWEVNEDSADDKQVTLHAGDGIHLSELGQLAMAYGILKGLGAPAEVSAAGVDAAAGTLLNAERCTVTDIRQIDGGLEFTRLDHGLPFNNGLFYSLNYRLRAGLRATQSLSAEGDESAVGSVCVNSGWTGRRNVPCPTAECRR